MHVDLKTRQEMFVQIMRQPCGRLDNANHPRYDAIALHNRRSRKDKGAADYRPRFCSDSRRACSWARCSFSRLTASASSRSNASRSVSRSRRSR